jgi:hypothetical protein
VFGVLAGLLVAPIVRAVEPSVVKGRSLPSQPKEDTHEQAGIG